MNSEEYEEIRNMTLLFFLEKLIDKGQSRSLHDLSCQFGKKGFTKEMKQIAGNSQSGLRKFLQNYPFIFTIQGDQVSAFDAFRFVQWSFGHLLNCLTHTVFRHPGR